MRIVALVPGGIAEQIAFFPTLEDLKQSYPEAEIDVVVEPKAKAAYRISKSVNDVLTFDYGDRNSPADWANLLGVVRDRYYTAAIYTGQGWGAGLLLWLTGIPRRIGYASGASKGFLTHAVPFKLGQPLTEQYHDLLQGTDITRACSAVTISIPKSDLDWAEAEQKRLGIKDSGYVLIQGGSGFTISGEIYPVDRWKEIAQSFRQRQPDLPLVLLQGATDRELIAALVQAQPDLKVTSPGDVGKLAAMLAGANLLLCTDAGLMRIAAALQVYTLALCSSTAPDELLAATDKFVSIRSAGKLADIPVAQVLEKVWGT